MFTRPADGEAWKQVVRVFIFGYTAIFTSNVCRLIHPRSRFASGVSPVTEVLVNKTRNKFLSPMNIAGLCLNSISGLVYLFCNLNFRWVCFLVFCYDCKSFVYVCCMRCWQLSSFLVEFYCSTLPSSPQHKYFCGKQMKQNAKLSQHFTSIFLSTLFLL